MYYPGITHCIWVPFFAEWRLQCAESPTVQPESVQRPVPPRAHLAAWRWPCRSSSSSCARRATFADMERGHTAAAVTKTAPRSRMAPDRARSRPRFDLDVRRRPPPSATSPMSAAPRRARHGIARDEPSAWPHEQFALPGLAQTAPSPRHMPTRQVAHAGRRRPACALLPLRANCVGATRLRGLGAATVARPLAHRTCLIAMRQAATAVVQMARARGQGPPWRAWRPASPSLGPPLLRVFGDRFSSRPRPVLGPHAQDDVALAW